MSENKNDNSGVILLVCILFMGVIYYLLFTIAKIIIWKTKGTCGFIDAVNPGVISLTTIASSGVALLFIYFIMFLMIEGGGEALTYAFCAIPAISATAITIKLHIMEINKITRTEN